MYTSVLNNDWERVWTVCLFRVDPNSNEWRHMKHKNNVN